MTAWAASASPWRPPISPTAAGVAEDHLAVLVADDDALGQGVERAAAAGWRPSRGLGHGLGGGLGDLFEVAHGGLDRGIGGRGIEAEPSPDGGQPLRQRPSTHAAAEE